MDLNPLTPKVANTSTGGARHGSSGDGGFRGLMDLMAHLSAGDRPRPEETRRPEEARRQADDSGQRTERTAPAAKNSAARSSNDDSRPAAKPAGDRQQAETDDVTVAAPAAPPETRHASAAPTPGSNSDAATEPAGASDADAVPPVPASTLSPSRVGAPATGKAASTAAAPSEPAQAATAAGQPASEPGNGQAATGHAPAAQSTAAESPTTPVPDARAPGTQTGGDQTNGTQTNGAQTGTAQTGVAQTGVAQLPATGATTSQAPVAQQPAAPHQATQGQATQGQTAQGRGSIQQPAAAQPTATAALEAAPRPATDGKPMALPSDAKVSVEPGTVVARTQGVSAAVLVQAHMAAVGDATGKAGGLAGHGLIGQGLAEQPLAGQGLAGQAAAPQSTQPLHVGGGQALFVGADAGDGQAGAQAGGGQNGGGQAGQNGSQAQAGGFAFGAATIGQRGFGGDAARAQFQEILSTRTARAPLQGPGATTPGGTTPLSFTAGPGGPQSTLTTAMVSRAEAPAQGRPGALASTAVGQVAMKLAGAAADGGGRVTIRLNPEELGKVDVKLEFGRDGSIRALISAERPETLDMLQRDARVLDKALQEAGLKTDQNSLQFNLQGGNGQPAGRDDRQTAKLDREPTGPENAHNDEVEAASLPDAGGVRADGSYDLVA